MAFDKSKFIPRFLTEAKEHLGFIQQELGGQTGAPQTVEISEGLVRAVHTLKGSAKILGLTPIAQVSLRLEEVFRALHNHSIPRQTGLLPLLNEAVALLAGFIIQVESGEEITADTTAIIENLQAVIKGEYQAPEASVPEQTIARISTPITEGPAPEEEPDLGEKRPGGFNRDKFVRRFVDEAREHIENLNQGLIHLEAEPDDSDTLSRIFRVAHTLKGASKILGLKPISLLAHKIEDALDALRNQRIALTKGLCDLLFKSLDLISDFIEQLAAGKNLDTDIRPYIEALESAARGETFTPAEKLALPSNVESENESALVQTQSGLTKTIFKSAMSDTVRISTEKLDETVKLMGEIVSNHIRMKQNVLDIDELGKLFTNYLSVLSRVSQNPATPLNGETLEVIESARTIQGKLKSLSSQTKDVMSFQSLVTDDLREKVLRMRMLPLSTVLDGFPRLVRDLSEACDKQIQLEIVGAETELDKKIIEKIGDPLLHMVRNSIDHGIESPEKRTQSGKSQAGNIKISAEYEGGHVLIKISDDGGGLPIDKIREKAILKKLYDEETAQHLSDAEVINLIFQPGFSTSSLVTEVSGRGVGMDVVRNNIVKHLKGSLQIDTKKGKGTTFLIRLPLTLAVMRVMLVAVGDTQVAIPLNSIQEIIRVPADSLIEVVNRQAVSLRDQIIPVAELAPLLALSEFAPQTTRRPKSNLVILLVVMGSEVLGLIVDEIVTEEDMEIKPLPPHMKDNELVSGITLSGKNEVVLVLQVTRLFSLARESGETVSRTSSHASSNPLHILVVDDSVSTQQVEKTILESHGYRVDLASDGVEAYEMAMETQYDLILTDIEMPRMDGFILTESLRTDTRYRNTPIIILSSRDHEEDKQRGKDVGANGYLIKGSFDPQQMITTLQSLLP